MTTCCLLGTSSTAFLTSNHMKSVVSSDQERFEVNNYQTLLHMVKPVASLKPAANPLMNSGKAIARTGELIIDLTSALDLYGGGLSSAGANIRNAGDHIAQAAASCRFKTGAELVCDEMREGATCFLEASQDFLKKAVDEADTDQDMNLKQSIGMYNTIITTFSFSLSEKCFNKISTTKKEKKDFGVKRNYSDNLEKKHLISNRKLFFFRIFLYLFLFKKNQIMMNFFHVWFATDDNTIFI